MTECNAEIWLLLQDICDTEKISAYKHKQRLSVMQITSPQKLSLDLKNR